MLRMLSGVLLGLILFGTAAAAKPTRYLTITRVGATHVGKRRVPPRKDIEGTRTDKEALYA